MNKPDDAPNSPFAPLPQNTFDGLALARKLLRATPAGALATLTRDAGYPFASLTSVATDCDGAPAAAAVGPRPPHKEPARRRARLPAAGRGRQGRSAGASAADRRRAPGPDRRRPGARPFPAPPSQIGALCRFPGLLLLAARTGSGPSQRRFRARRRLSRRRRPDRRLRRRRVVCRRGRPARRGQCAVARGARQIGAGGGRGPRPPLAGDGARSGRARSRGAATDRPARVFAARALCCSVAGRPGGGAAGGSCRRMTW